MPVLVTVTVCGVDVLPTRVPGKVRLVGLRPTSGAAAVPMPERSYVWGDGGLVALSVKERIPLADPVDVGVNSTSTVQLPRVGIGFVQLSETIE